jgi:putative ABC transport system substrate-binding protein
MTTNCLAAADRLPEIGIDTSVIHFHTVKPLDEVTVLDYANQAQAVVTVEEGTIREIDAAFANLSQKPGGALLVSPDALFFNRRAQILTLAARHALPTIYYDREFVDAGGLMSYGADRVITFQQAGIYTGRILKGEKPADLPIMQPTKFELVINLNTARALDIEPSSTLLALADEVIE